MVSRWVKLPGDTQIVPGYRLHEDLIKDAVHVEELTLRIAPK